MSSDTESSKETGTSHPPIALPEGTRLREEYRVEEVLGMGSFGITYRAVDEHLDTSVAIKEYYPRQIAGRTNGSVTVRPHSSEATEDFDYGLQQFMEEGRTVARFDHRNLVDIKSYFEENGTGYLVMAYYEGQTLADYLAENNGRLPEEEAVELIKDVLEGLNSIHEAGVLHRDIDPQNVYRTEEGEPILIDFGAAREAMGARSQSLDVILKPGYAPIEQYSSDGNQGPWTDVYACAATLYKCLTGIKPPEATDRVQEDSLAAPRDLREEITMETSLAVRKGLAVRAGSRPASAREFAELLGRTQTEKTTRASVDEDPRTKPSGTRPSEVVGSAGQASAARPSTSMKVGDQTASTVHEPNTLDLKPDSSPTAVDSPNAAGSSVWSPIAMTGGSAAVVAGSLLLSDAGPVQVLAFFGSWYTMRRTNRALLAGRTAHESGGSRSNKRLDPGRELRREDRRLA